MKSRLQYGVAVLTAAAPLMTACSQSTELPLEKLNLPEGLEVAVYARVPDARSIKLAGSGSLFVGNRGGDKVYAAVDSDEDGRAETVHTIATGLNMPNGIAVKGDTLYVAEVHRLLRFDNISDNLADPPDPVVVVDDLPEERHHGWRYIAFGPDGRLYLAIGAPCNVCEQPDPYASIISMEPDGSDRAVVARGVRNSVGFDWNPETGRFWFTDNGRDMLGDNRPPDELNRLTETGAHYGFPYVHGGDILDPQFGSGHDPAEFVAPAQKLGPHVAALGMEFYDGKTFPEEYHGQIFVAEHGSWNRSEKIGYRVSLIRLDDAGNPTSYEPFIDGWLQGDQAWGRPVDLEIMPDGSLLVSDDKAGVVYRVWYRRGRLGHG